SRFGLRLDPRFGSVPVAFRANPDRLPCPSPAPPVPREPHISVVVPVYNEEESLPTLQAEIAAALTPLARPFEVVYVDDRSSDRSLAILRELQAHDPRIRVIGLRSRSGQTAAMAAGFDHARG